MVLFDRQYDFLLVFYGLLSGVVLLTPMCDGQTDGLTDGQAGRQFGSCTPAVKF